MLKNKFLTVLSALILVASAQAGYAAQTVAPQKNQAEQTPEILNIDLLYVQVAPSATLSKTCDKAGVCQEKLTLNDVPEFMLTFNNGKPRIGAQIVNQRFVKQYYNISGKSSKLNTALLAYDHGKVQEHLITIANPVYSAEKHEMTYDITFIKKFDPLESESKLVNVSLYIDGVCASCVGRP